MDRLWERVPVMGGSTARDPNEDKRKEGVVRSMEEEVQSVLERV